MESRRVLQSLQGKEQTDLLGNSIIGTIGIHQMRFLDPFRLMLDFKMKAPGGFPDRTKRGIETITYVLKGKLRHEDCLKNDANEQANNDIEGNERNNDRLTIVGPGYMQYMIAGTGIKHCDVPFGESETHALQLWIDLSDSQIEPFYKSMKCEVFLSRKDYDGVHMRVIAEAPPTTEIPLVGAGLTISHNNDKSLNTNTPIMFYEFILDKNAEMYQTIPTTWNAFIYIISGEATFGQGDDATEYNDKYTLILDTNGDGITVKTSGLHECHFVLIGGQPHGEKRKQYGGFVIKDGEEMDDIIADFKAGRNGFENTFGWDSDYVINH